MRRPARLPETAPPSSGWPASFKPINTVQADEARTLENEAFLARMMAACLRVAFQIFVPKL